MLGFIHAGAQLRPAGAQLVGNLPPDLCRGGMIGLEEDWRMAAATTVFWPLGTYASALRMKWTRQRCQVALRTRVIAALRPSWASEMTSLTPSARGGRGP
ncbi:hypothetical protein SPKIRA_20960 [Sphingomonas paucimobilis]|nr:hypothetical protein SPKIRA_02650 [Sphingomonas paucimobilis]BCI71266.1 hypothetical protein SPKIRA_20960 [Sphingomonas paucimobilis]